MRKNLPPKAYIYPMPVLVVATYDENGVANAMTAAWGTVCDTAQITICIDKSHKTAQNLLKTKALTVAIADKQNVVLADYLGIVSGNSQPDKVQKSGCNIIKSQFVNAPILQNFPLVLECEMVSYNLESEMCVANVINVSAEEGILDKNGKIDLTKFKPICYDCDTYGYYTLGEKVGQAYKDGKKIK